MIGLCALNGRDSGVTNNGEAGACSVDARFNVGTGGNVSSFRRILAAEIDTVRLGNTRATGASQLNGGL